MVSNERHRTAGSLMTEDNLVLVTQGYSYEPDGNTLTYTFGDTSYGIRHPYMGLFVLLVETEVPDGVCDDGTIVMVDNIYGKRRQVIVGREAVTWKEWGGIGVYTMIYDTDNQILRVTSPGWLENTLEWQEF